MCVRVCACMHTQKINLDLASMHTQKINLDLASSNLLNLEKDERK